jgi:enoyl-CoA hydratase/carnithine racemase
MSQSVLLSVEEGVATFSLQPPQVFNAMDADMMLQLRAAARLRGIPQRAVVLRGEGFLAGGDGVVPISIKEHRT